MTDKRTLKVAVLGCGAVGSQVVRLLIEQRDDLAARVGVPVELADAIGDDPAGHRVTSAFAAWGIPLHAAVSPAGTRRDAATCRPAPGYGRCWCRSSRQPGLARPRQ